MPAVRTRDWLAVVFLLSVFASGCEGDSATPEVPSVSSPSVASDEVGCGMVEEDLVVEAIGTDVKAVGTGILPPDQADFRPMDCTIQSVTDSLTFMKIGVGIPPMAKLEASKRSWPTSEGEMDCPGAWLAPGQNTYAASCVTDDAPPGAKSTSLRALFGKYSISVAIVRPEPRSTDAETAFRISQDVAARLPH